MKKIIFYISLIPYIYILVMSVIMFHSNSFEYYYDYLFYFIGNYIENYWFTFLSCFIYQVFCLCDFLNDNNKVKNVLNKMLLFLSIVFLGLLFFYFVFLLVKAFFFGTSGFLCMDWGNCEKVYGLKAIFYTFPFIVVIVVELIVIPVIPFTLSYIVCHKVLNKKKKIKF